MRSNWLVGIVGIIALTSSAHAQQAAPAGVQPASGEPAGEPAAPSIPAPSAVPDPALAPPGSVAVRPRSLATYPAPAPPYVENSYRWQVIAADAAAFVLVSSRNSQAATLGAVTYVLGAPVIHGLNGESGRTMLSLGLRVGLPLLGAAALGALASSGNSCRPDDDDCDSGVGFGILFGLGLGIVAAVVVDDLIIARPHKIYSDQRITLAPQVSVDHDRTSFGLAGRF